MRKVIIALLALFALTQGTAAADKEKDCAKAMPLTAVLGKKASSTPQTTALDKKASHTPQTAFIGKKASHTPQIVAHRGYWKTEGSAQNSIRSLVKADSIGVYGSEFDVWLTADDELIVNHDPHIGQLVIERSTAADIKACRLSNGEHVPTLTEYLDAARGLKTRLVLELKSHDDKLRELAAVDRIIALVKAKKLTRRVDYITFSLPAYVRLIQKAPKGTPVYYLNGDLSPEEILETGGTGVDYNLGVFRAHPEWIGRCRELGLKTNVWTVNRREDLQWCIDQGVDFITTNEPEMLKEMIK